jgi:hypothetical protein
VFLNEQACCSSTRSALQASHQLCCQHPHYFTGTASLLCVPSLDWCALPSISLLYTTAKLSNLSMPTPAPAHHLVLHACLSMCCCQQVDELKRENQKLLQIIAQLQSTSIACISAPLATTTSTLGPDAEAEGPAGTASCLSAGVPPGSIDSGGPPSGKSQFAAVRVSGWG